MAALSSKRYPSVCIVFLTVASSSTASPGKRSILTVSSLQLHAGVNHSCTVCLKYHMYKSDQWEECVWKCCYRCLSC
jgi:hypothetical protein